MRGLFAIYRRELGSYFVSPIAYVVIGLFLLISGFFFYNILGSMIQHSLMADMRSAQMGGGAQKMDVAGLVVRNFFGVVSTIILFLVPMLTMGVYSEERKRGTMELLMTSPVTEFQIVAAKFLAAFTLFLLMIVPTIIYHLILGMYSEPAPPWRSIASGYLGLVLLGAVLVAIGTFISSLTESQIIAGVSTFAAFLMLWVLDFGVRDATTTTGEILKHLSILRHFEDFTRGVIDTTSVVFYLSMVTLGIFLTLRTLDSMRWRRA
jgi:ABC-2 type transport system permease protein